MKKNILILLTIVVVAASSCGKDLLDPEIENNRQLDPNAYIPGDARFPFGILLNGYNRIPTNGWSFNDVATDDAVTNDRNNGYLKMATGQWTAANNNMINQWQNSFAAIQYINIMLEEVNKVRWVSDEKASHLFAQRIRGEAYALRGLFMYHLLQAHGGVSGSGELLGVPIMLSSQTPQSDFNNPRATFKQCVDQMYKDLDSAIILLPLDYADLADGSPVPSKFGNITTVQYNRVFGAAFGGLMTERIARGIRARAALMVASPAFSSGSGVTWADAANYAAEVINMKGGIGGIAANGLTWYSNSSEIANLKDGTNPPEILWRNNYSDNNRDLESSNFPPTLFGNGRINPTQNLVDAFPMLNGFPIANGSSGYNPADPYANRDPRLKLFVLVNGSTAGVNNTAINTASDASTNDGLNKVETSTRTGYYLRKLLRQDVNLNPTSPSGQRHYKPHIRYTEIYLAYAEAANEAWGPLGTGNNAYSAYDVIKAIRKRAGIGVSNSDAYLESIKSNQEAMRTLIRNERRLELCFEGHRFWDLRRWNATLNEPAKGVDIRNNTYNGIQVEDRLYQSYMIYGPIPYSEILKFSALQQNKGW
ncbi:RagB/SusD family nutrient uptake outer membrane protein [Niabella aquatica]